MSLSFPVLHISEAQKAQNQQMIEEQHEAVRLRMNVARRTDKTQGPAVNGIIWTHGRPEDRPRTPILSILRFKFKLGVDILDACQIPRKLWDSSLQYVGSIPGCMSIEWGQSLAGPPSILCIVHWETVTAWQNFEFSFGFGLVAVLFAAGISDRCMKLQPGSVVALEKPGSILEEVSFTFESGILPALKLKFEADWANAIASFAEGSLLSVRNNWIEQNASPDLDPTPEQVAASQVPVVFTGILVWNVGNYDSQVMALLCTTLGDKLSSDLKWNFSQIAIELVQELSKHNTRPPAPLVSLAHNSIASTLKFELPPQFGRDHGVRQSVDQYAYESMAAAREGRRLYPAPWGSFKFQGILSQDNAVIYTRPQQISHHNLDKNFIVDVLWLRFNSDAIPPVTTDDLCGTQHTINKEDLTEPFRYLHSEISLLSGYEAAFWARDIEEQTAAALLTVWQDPIARAASIQKYYQIVDTFTSSTSDFLSAPPNHQVLPLCSSTHLNFTPCLELISFSIPCGKLNQQIFEDAYVGFEQITRLHSNVWPPTACRPLSTGGWLPSGLSDHTDSPGMQSFTGALVWQDQAARQEWYSDLLRRAASSYEQLGHKLDALKILATGGVESRFLSLSKF